MMLVARHGVAMQQPVQLKNIRPQTRPGEEIHWRVLKRKREFLAGWLWAAKKLGGEHQ
jgi:4'-phosphopantetheinyl transferase EntD